MAKMRKASIRSRDRAGGFTLVELMVVLVILGLAAAVVVLAMPDEGGSLQSEAERFAARAKAARDNAIVESRPALLRVDAEGYGVARRARGEWVEDARLDWASGTEVLVEGVDGAQTRFDTTGLASPLSVTLRRRNRQVAVAIEADGSVHVRR
jgi:general secretion pathway protein H